MTPALLLAAALASHSGGTDANGCHVDSSTGVQHCHNTSGGGGGGGSGGGSGLPDLGPTVTLLGLAGCVCAGTLVFSAVAGAAAVGLLYLSNRLSHRAQQGEIERPPVSRDDLLRPKKVPSAEPPPPAPDRERQRQLVQQCQEQGISLEECWRMVR